jgi:outer membrane biosynthesis protein TonB
MKQHSMVTVISAALLLTGYAGSAAATETNFPARTRTLEITAPAECREWVAPVPERRVNVQLPLEGKVFNGAAQVTFTISPEGRYGGLVEAKTNDAAFVRAAEESLKYWTFTAASCNGKPISVDARIYFNFRYDSFVSYGAGSYIQ